jgi:DNA-binding NtrC family response regulator
MNTPNQQTAARVLIVEDEKLVVWSLSETLKRAGFSVTAVQTGESAIEKLLAGKFDLVITDMNLPRVNGFEVASIAKNSQPSIPVIMITAAEMHPADELRNGGCVDFFVEKPFDLKEVTTLVEHCISHAHEA